MEAFNRIIVLLVSINSKKRYDVGKGYGYCSCDDGVYVIKNWKQASPMYKTDEELCAYLEGVNSVLKGESE